MEPSTDLIIQQCKDLLPIWASIITALATLAAVVVANVINNKNNQKILNRNIQQDKFKFRLSKLEEIYESFLTWETLIHETELIYITYYSGNYNKKQLVDELSKRKTLDAGDCYRKVQLLCDMYFSECQKGLEDVNKSKDNLSKYFNLTDKAKNDNDKFIELVECGKVFESESSKFKNSLAILAKNL
jgi:hypothetical protein